MTTMYLEQHLLRKYPRTPHLEGSRLQEGDDVSLQTPYSKIAGRYIVVEEKIDCAQSGLSYSAGGEQLLQSKGHFLDGGPNERQFALFKRWASIHEDRLLDVLEDRFLMFGEWSHVKHAIYYDSLPHYFNEFDIWDRSREIFLSTDERLAILRDVPVLPVPVLYRGLAPTSLDDLFARIALQRAGVTRKDLRRQRPTLSAGEQALPRSLAKSENWERSFESVVAQRGHNLEQCWKQTDKSDRLEGFYIKVEEDGAVVERYKWVRADFVQAIKKAGKHHSEQPFVPNQLAPGADVFADRLTMTWADLGLVTVEE